MDGNDEHQYHKRRTDQDPSEMTRLTLEREITSVRQTLDLEVSHHQSLVDAHLQHLRVYVEQAVESRSQEIGQLRKTLDERQAAQSEAIRTALTARRTEVEIALVQIERLVESVTATMDEKFVSVEKALGVVERQRIEQKADTKAAVDAALIAQKEAVQEQTIASGLSIAKSEAATAKQLDQQAITAATAFSGVDASIADVKDRIARSEATMAAVLQAQATTAANRMEQRADRVDQRGGQSNTVGIVGGAIGVLAFLFFLIDRLTGVGATP